MSTIFKEKTKNYNNVPFAPKKFPFFYGWMILVLSATGTFMSMPGQTMGVSAFTEHLIKSLGISRSDLALAYMLGTLASSFILPHAGKVFDKAGARVMATVASIGMGAALILLSFSDKLAVGMSVTGIIIMMFFGFLMLRFWGQGVLTLTCRNMLMKWFDRRRGLVSGLSGPINSMVFSLTPVLLNELINFRGWQTAWLILGIASVFIFSLIALVFFRDNPEVCGMFPDGVTPEKSEEHEKSNTDIRQYTVSEARRTFPFWVVGLSLAVSGLYFTAMPFHVVSIFKQAGMEKDTALRIFFYGSCISVPMSIFYGYIADKINIKYLLAIFLAGVTINSLSVAFLKPGLTYGTLIFGMGLSGGLFGILISVTFPRFYGREHLGAISGFIMSMLVFSSAIGPWFFSKIFELSGNYRYASLTCSAFAVLLLACSFRIKNPQETKTQ